MTVLLHITETLRIVFIDLFSRGCNFDYNDLKMSCFQICFFYPRPLKLGTAQSMLTFKIFMTSFGDDRILEGTITNITVFKNLCKPKL